VSPAEIRELRRELIARAAERVESSRKAVHTARTGADRDRAVAELVSASEVLDLLLLTAARDAIRRAA
jgi:hypothetical protein